MVSIPEEAVQICLVKRNIIDTEDFANIGGKNYAV
jgi:hypothetical protein